MSKGFTGLNPGNQAFKQFKCPVLNVLKCPPLWNMEYTTSKNISPLKTVLDYEH